MLQYSIIKKGVCDFIQIYMNIHLHIRANRQITSLSVSTSIHHKRLQYMHLYMSILIFFQSQETTLLQYIVLSKKEKVCDLIQLQHTYVLKLTNIHKYNPFTYIM